MSERASESIVAQKIAPGDYRYTITLKDTGTKPIGTFWFAWVPGANFLPSKPHASAPKGWADDVISGGGYSIRWVANSSASALKAGHSMTFVFTSSAAPAAVFGKSKTHSPTKVTTSFIYSGMPFSDNGYEFSASSTKVASPVGWDMMAPANHADRGLLDAQHGGEALQGFDLFSAALAGGTSRF
jgi:hypothetical protein